MKLIMLGTGSASVTKCYNTCFAFEQEKEYFLVDAGGGNGILNILEQNRISVTDIRNIFITHSHTDHILGAVWLVRMIGQAINYDGCPHIFNIYCHDEAAAALKAICCATLPASVTKLFENRILINVVEDGDKVNILGCDVEFFDILSDKTKQFGFILNSETGRLACCGDEPLSPVLFEKIKGCDWLMHEAFCLYSEKDIFKPYQKFHSTSMDSCKNAEELGVKNLILYHTEDTHLDNRKQLYTQEGKEYFGGNIYVPDDNEIIEL